MNSDEQMSTTFWLICLFVCCCFLCFGGDVEIVSCSERAQPFGIYCSWRGGGVRILIVSGFERAKASIRSVRMCKHVFRTEDKI